MKKIISLLVAVLSLTTANACMKKSVVADKPLIVIVMDSTQALLPDAEVKVGKTVYKTSYDGRVVLKAEQLKGVSSLTVYCENYEPQKWTSDGSSLAIIQLVPKSVKTAKGGRARYPSLGSSDGEMATDVLYKAAYVMSAAPTPSMREKEDKRTMPVREVANVAAEAGKLTAGEVNDFTKWYFWPKVLDGSHKQFVGEWQMEPRERYTVQVVNKDGYPVANYPVNLTDEKGNTVFQAVTDNTGKAELWNSLITADGERLKVKEPEKTLVVDEPCAGEQRQAANSPSDVDVVFVFDATGSMGDELRYLQAEMKDVITRASKATGGLKIRTGAVVYRDHGDDYLTRLSRLTEDIKTTQAFIDKQRADGGGDYPEAVPEALMAALNSAGWNECARTRIAFLILDAPCHQDSATIALLHEQVLNAAAQGVRIVPVVCSGLGESGEFLLRSMALATNGTSFFLTDDSGIGHSHLKPTTDSLKVEHLNDMLVRTIVEFSYMPECAETVDESEEEGISGYFLPNPFSTEDLTADPTIPHGEGVHYLLDVSGKLMGIFEGEVKTDQLPIGVYFIKTYYDGQWFTKKILVR